MDEFASCTLRYWSIKQHNQRQNIQFKGALSPFFSFLGLTARLFSNPVLLARLIRSFFGELVLKTKSFNN
ncbi:MAG: hypothetical protein RL204_600 [Bacteroidota bacterium]|jgi:hypothetical protein